jgi:hypothetical protein
MEAKDKAATVRVPKDCTVKIDEWYIPVHLILPPFWDELLVTPQGLQDFSIKANIPCLLKAAELLITLDTPLIRFEASFEANLTEI